MSFKRRVIAVLERLLHNRWPWIGGAVRLEAVAALIEDGSPEAVQALMRALAGAADPSVRDMIWANMERLIHHAGEEGIPGLRRFDALTDWVLSPQQPDWVRLPNMENQARSALMVGDLPALKAYGPEWIAPLLASCDDPDRRVRSALEKTLRALEKPESREALCRALIEKDYPLARAAVVEQSIAPEDLTARALFFFLTGQWERYETLDFDHRLLRAAYLVENAGVRRRILDRLRLTGHADLLSGVIGQDSAGIAGMAADEFELVVGMLRSHRDWDRLWPLVFETTLPWSTRILAMLAGAASWAPPEAERALFAELRALWEAGMLLDAEALSQELPRLLLQAHLRAPGRINDVIFAPQRPWLGVATGARKVALWNYQTAQCERVLEGFAHSVGRLAFTRDGDLVCAERPYQADAPAGIYAWNESGLRQMGQHQGQVTALEAVTGSTFLSAGRDRDLALWDAASGQQVARQTLRDWPRAVRVAPDGDMAMVLLHREIHGYDLPGMRSVTRAAHPTAPTCAAFGPAGSNRLFVGFRDGSVALYRRYSSRLTKERDLCTHALAVQGIEVLPQRGYALTAGREGEVRFLSLPKYDQIDWAPLSGKGLTSLHVSPDEAFLAIGHADASCSLWDLRGPEAVSLLGMPLASLPPLALGVLEAFAVNSKLKEPVRRTAAYAAAILRHRMRFDIELETEEVLSIRTGEFDIELG